MHSASRFYLRFTEGLPRGYLELTYDLPMVDLGITQGVPRVHLGFTLGKASKATAGWLKNVGVCEAQICEATGIIRG